MQMGKRLMESAKKGGWEEADVLILLTENHPRREKERNVRCQLDENSIATRRAITSRVFVTWFTTVSFSLSGSTYCKCVGPLFFSISPAQGSASLGILESPHSAACNPKRT